MTDEGRARLRALLAAQAERRPNDRPGPRATDGPAERRRRACAESLRSIVRPVLEEFAAELRGAGHEAATRDHTNREDAYPSVALSFTPHYGTGPALASALMFKYDPGRGILVLRDVKAAPGTERVAGPSGDHIGTIGMDAVSTPWVETKTLSFVAAVLKVN
jgi:hypothetical protein